MAKKKLPKAKVKKVVYKKKDHKKEARSRKSRMVSFFVGVATVAAIGFLVFQYAQTNNYKEVLGERTDILRQQGN